MELLLLMLLLFVLLLFLFCFWMFFFSFTLCMAQEGYLQLVKASSMCDNSSFFCSWLEQMLFALCNKEFITLYLLAMEWWLSHCKYWLVWVGFLYMEVDRLLSSSTMTKVSKNGSDPSALVFSAVNWIFSSMPFKWLYHLPRGNNISPSHKSGYSICHISIKNQPLAITSANITTSNMWQRHQPQMAITSAIKIIGNNIS